MEPQDNKPADQESEDTFYDQDSESPGESAQANRSTDEHRAPNEPAEGARD